MSASYPLLEWQFPIAGVAFYIATIYFFWPKKEKLATTAAARKPTSTTLKTFILLHNLALAIFSGYVFYGTAPQFWSEYQKFGQTSATNFMLKAYKGDEWKKFEFYGWLFYVSKFYEFVDTWIIMLKGGKPGILQTYHHVGAVITIWAAVITKSPCCWVFVIFNSLIHAFMYTYYCLTTLGYRPSWKIIMTLMQITQFFGGIFISFYYLNTPNTHTPAQICVLALMLMYTSVLLYLFCEFAFQTYFVKKDKLQQSTSSKKSK